MCARGAARHPSEPSQDKGGEEEEKKKSRKKKSREIKRYAEEKRREEKKERRREEKKETGRYARGEERSRNSKRYAEERDVVQYKKREERRYVEEDERDSRDVGRENGGRGVVGESVAREAGNAERRPVRVVPSVWRSVEKVAGSVEQSGEVGLRRGGSGAGANMFPSAKQPLGRCGIQSGEDRRTREMDVGRASEVVERRGVRTGGYERSAGVLAPIEGSSETGMGKAKAGVAVEEEVPFVSGGSKNIQRVINGPEIAHGNAANGNSVTEERRRHDGPGRSGFRIQPSADTGRLPKMVQIPDRGTVIPNASAVFRASDSPFRVYNDSESGMEVSSDAAGRRSGIRGSRGEAIRDSDFGVYRRFVSDRFKKSIGGSVEEMGVAGDGGVGLVLGVKERMVPREQKKVSGISFGRERESGPSPGKKSPTDSAGSAIHVVERKSGVGYSFEDSREGKSRSVGHSKRPGVGMGNWSDDSAVATRAFEGFMELGSKKGETRLEIIVEGGSVDTQRRASVEVAGRQRQFVAQTQLGLAGSEMDHSRRIVDQSRGEIRTKGGIGAVTGGHNFAPDEQSVTSRGGGGSSWTRVVRDGVDRSTGGIGVGQQGAGSSFQQHANGRPSSVGGGSAMVLPRQRNRAPQSIVDPVKGNDTARSGSAVAAGGRERLVVGRGDLLKNSVVGPRVGGGSFRVWSEREASAVEQSVPRAGHGSGGRVGTRLDTIGQLRVRPASNARASGGSVVGAGSTSGSGDTELAGKHLVATVVSHGAGPRRVDVLGQGSRDIRVGPVREGFGNSSRAMGVLGGEGELAWPRELEELYRQAVLRMSGGLKAATLKSYEREMALFNNWREKWKMSKDLPAPTWHVMAYLEWISQTRGPGVASKVLASIEKIHILRQAPMQKDPLLKQLADSLKKQSMRRRNPEKVSELPVEAIITWAEKVKREKGQNKLHRQWLVGLVLGVRAIKRSADMVKVKIGHVKQRVGGGVTVYFPDTKNHPEGEVVPIEPAGDSANICPVRLLWEWIAERKRDGAKDDDWLFTKAKGGPTDSGFWSQAVKAAVTEAQERSVLERGGKWSSRSMRSGGAARMQALGYGEAAIMALGGWMSNAMQHYLRKTHLAQENLSQRMFEGGTRH